jgi:hypothetical protein
MPTTELEPCLVKVDSVLQRLLNVPFRLLIEPPLGATHANKELCLWPMLLLAVNFGLSTFPEIGPVGNASWRR